ncbi:MAG: hypothetical protein ABI583_12925, partial [Betaproteobacteria bacterium]
MERATTRTVPHTRLLSQIDIDLQQQLKKLGVTQQDMAHFDGLFLGRKRLSQNRAVCSRPLRGIFYSPSSNLINWVTNAIKITDHAQSQQFNHRIGQAYALRNPLPKRITSAMPKLLVSKASLIKS